MSPGALWVFLPLLGSFLVHAVVLRWDLMPRLKRPLDGGVTFRGRRLLGDNKTWRGALAMGSGIFVLALALRECPWYRSRLPDAVQASSAPLFAAAAFGLVTIAHLTLSAAGYALGVRRTIL